MTAVVLEGQAPRGVLPHLWAFAPNRNTLGGTAYYLDHPEGGILVDCPAWNRANLDFLADRGVRILFLTHRGGMGATAQWQAQLDCEVVVQEQEAYLLPDVPKDKQRSFQAELAIAEAVIALWTPGHSPGSACLYWNIHGGVLFTGRHLLPNKDGHPVPLITRKTFHGRRQQRSLEQLIDRFSAETLRYICPGAHTGPLQGKGFIDQAYNRLRNAP